MPREHEIEHEIPQPPIEEIVEHQNTPNKPSKLSPTQKEAIISFIDYLIDHLTLKRFILLTILGACGIVLFSIYENRASIAQHAISYALSGMVDRTNNNITNWALSDKSRQDLKTFTDQNPILFTSVTEVNLKRNTRRVHYTNLSEKFPAALSQNKINSEVQIVHTVFDHDPRNTTQMVAVLGNEFRCDPFVDTTYYKVIPEAGNYIETVCRIAIPPYVGKFIGFLSVGISKKLTKPELDQIRLELSRIAVEIYLRDIEQKPV